MTTKYIKPNRTFSNGETILYEGEVAEVAAECADLIVKFGWGEYVDEPKKKGKNKKMPDGEQPESQQDENLNGAPATNNANGEQPSNPQDDNQQQANLI